MDDEQQIAKKNGKVVVQLLTRTDKRTVDELTDTIHHYSQVSYHYLKSNCCTKLNALHLPVIETSD